MTKLLQNKTLIKFLGIALSILLIVALIPQIGIAYGSKDDVVGETPMAETGEGNKATDEGEEAAEDGDEVATPEDGTENAEGEDAVEGEVSVVDGVEMVSLKVEVPGEEDEDTTENAIAPQSLEDEGKKAARVQSRMVLDPEEPKITIGENIDYTKSSPLTFNRGTHTLTIKKGCTFTGDILITGGAEVTIKGSGTIKGTHTSSVITVEGAGSKLILGGEDNEGVVTGPTITNGAGSTGPSIFNDGAQKVGGGIYVYNKGTLDMRAGTITGNTANAGGGVFVWTDSFFTMAGGEISSNTATTHEGGGIFFDGQDGYISGGSILNNTTNTTVDWGGGGVYINNNGSMRIDSARITGNVANALGGGIAGCPHAKIGIGKLGDGAAVYANDANMGPEPNNDVLRFNMPITTNKDASYRVPSGDVLVYGASKDQSYTPWGTSTTYTACTGTYARNDFDKEYAQDYYCTLASSIAGTDLGNADGVAWTGFVAKIDPNKISANSVDSNDVDCYKISIRKNTDYSIADATLCLTSEATKDLYDRKVIISGNTSGTHGGGISCNGTLSFGPRPATKEVVDGYNLTLNKKLITNLSGDKGVDLSPGKFKFVLSYEKDGEIKTCSATNDADGKIVFKGLPGSKVNGSEVTYTLKEELSEEQIKAGYKSPIPEKGWKVVVTQKVSSEVHNIPPTKETIYTTVADKIVINGEVTDTVTNTLNLKSSESIPVKKVVHGVNEGSFEFVLNDVTNSINDLIDANAGTVKANRNIAAEARKGTSKVSYTFEELANQNKAFEFTYKTEEDLKSHWYAIAETPGTQEDVSYDDTAYLVKVDVFVADGGRSLKTAKIIYKVAPGSTRLEEVREEIGVTFTNVKMEYVPFKLALNKQVITPIQNQVVGWNDLSDVNKKFHFSVYDPKNNEVIFEGENEGNDISLEVVEGKKSAVEGYVKAAYQEYLKNPTDAFEYTVNNLKLKEEMPAGVVKDDHMTLIEDADVTITLGIESAKRAGDNTSFQVIPKVKAIALDGTRVEKSTVSNLYEPHGDWTLKANKHFQGLGEPAAEGYDFAMAELDVKSDDEIQNAEQLANLPIKKDSEGKELTWAGRTEDFQKNEGGSYEAQITFDPVSYVVKQDNTFDVVNGENHYYLVTETAPEGGSVDATAFVVKVNVKQNKTKKTVLEANEVECWYADDVNQAVVDTVDAIEFYNTDTQHMISAASYSVYAASGEPVDQVCYVDPKIIKNLEGRAIKSGEFAFKLIEVANYNDTEGTVISATTNDEFGMVDFDKANNVSGDLENPSCLAYTKPGTYYYRVIEDTTKGGMNDQSVLYSDQVITFTTVIEQDEATGRLVCTDMYYGYWDKAANKNVRYDEQYTDFDTQPANIGDMSKLNPDWHPTITNKTRPMDIQVRKTSVTDRAEGLVGATYALYVVNENAQGDIKLAEATSEDGGWITYKNVSLSTNNLYYFKETAAPAGHTVSEFRSSYFYLVEDASSANGYALQYTDTKFLAEAAAAAEPQAVALLDETDAQTAAEAANEAAGNTETQPGHSAAGNVLLTYDKDGGVHDEATQVEVNKLDTRTHEWVEGAKLVILEKESGKEIASWTSGKAPQKLEKTLNVGTTYLLREVEAPNQYRLANDVEFVIDDYGNVSITKGTENGNAELSDNSITLYDTMMDAEEVETVEREKSTTEKPKSDTLLAKTGDMLPILGIALVALAALIVVIVAVRRRRASEDETTQS